MPVTVTEATSRLRIRFQTGVDGEGNPELRTRTYSNVKPEALNDDLFDVAKGLESLQEHEAAVIRRIDEADLVEEE